MDHKNLISEFIKVNKNTIEKPTYFFRKNITEPDEADKLFDK